ncbi:hypothetical protein ACPYPG_03835 [Streptomyces sp. FR-108]|uniref:hypothetical protein n=1 Tax=Streptomyces sp. FR-108 TaxID=3416665 RepID=UPI003CF735AD
MRASRTLRDYGLFACDIKAAGDEVLTVAPASNAASGGHPTPDEQVADESWSRTTCDIVSAPSDH